MLELESRHLATVRRILEVHVPGCDVRAFGSLVQGRAKLYSDLDLAVMAASPLPIDVKVRFEHTFAEPDLPFKVARCSLAEPSGCEESDTRFFC